MHVKHGNIVKPETNASVYAAEPTVPASPVPATPTPVPKPATPTGHATEQPSRVSAKLEVMHVKYGHILRPQDYEQAPHEKSAAAATEQSKEATEMIYSIVNEFLGKMTMKNPEAEHLLRTALKDESCLTPSKLQCITEVFSPIFFYYCLLYTSPSPRD